MSSNAYGEALAELIRIDAKNFAEHTARVLAIGEKVNVSLPIEDFKSVISVAFYRGVSSAFKNISELKHHVGGEQLELPLDYGGEH